MVIVHDRVLRYAEKDVIEDEFGVMEDTRYDTKGLATYLVVPDGEYNLKITSNDKLLIDTSFSGPWKGYVVAEYVDKPEVSQLPVNRIEDIPMGYAKYIITTPSKPYLVVARGDITKTLRVITRNKEYVFTPIDINGDGGGFRAIFIQGEKIEGLYIEHNGLDVKLIELSPILDKNKYDATIELYKVQ